MGRSILIVAILFGALGMGVAWLKPALGGAPYAVPEREEGDSWKWDAERNVWLPYVPADPHLHTFEGGRVECSCACEDKR